MTTEMQHSTTTLSKTETSLKYLFRSIISVTIILAFCVFCWLSYLNYECESFWGEKCVIVAAPQSIQENFTEDWYVTYNQQLREANRPASSSTTTK